MAVLDARDQSHARCATAWPALIARCVDASLVALGEALNIETVFTTDRRGFSTYRPSRSERFTLIPEP